MRLPDDQLLAIMAASIFNNTDEVTYAWCIEHAEALLREVQSRQPQSDCLCVHAVPDFDGIHHDSRCALYKPDAEDIRSATLDGAIAVCRKYHNETAALIAGEIEALKPQPSKGHPQPVVVPGQTVVEYVAPAYDAALDEAIAALREYQSHVELRINKVVIGFAIDRIEALKSQPSKEEP